jgi:hypothetical protein
MEHYSIIDHSIVDRSVSDQGSPKPGSEPELEAGLEPGLEPDLAQSSVSRSSNPSVSAGIAAANAQAASPTPGDAGRHVSPRFPGEDSGHSMAEMAQRDLDAALQLLADRAQYITGAGGAAIALRRDECNDMLCRASSGAKAPELGALLSTESGLSGESVRTRMPLRCDDAEHDPRVNQESCRQLGIASVMIVPIMGDDPLGQDQVLGVFELFSGQAGAFEERDLSALQRLGEMVETAVKLARAAQGVPLEMVTPGMADQIPAGINPEITTEVNEEHGGTTGGLAAAVFGDEDSVLEVEMDDAAAELPHEAVAEAGAEAVMTAAPLTVAPMIAAAMVPPPAVDSANRVVPAEAFPAAIPASIPAAIPPMVVPAKEPPAKRPLMWSAAAHAGPEAARPGELDQSHVPPMLRDLRKCKACGFPVSEGRTLCVECDEKQWRGQPLPAAAKGRAAGPAVDFQGSRDSGLSIVPPKAGSTPGAAISSSPSASVAAAPVGPQTAPHTAPHTAPQSLVAALAELREQEARVEATRRGPIAVAARVVDSRGAAAVPGPNAVPGKEKPVEGTPAGTAVAPRQNEPVRPIEPARRVQNRPAGPNFSGGLGTSESWLSRNKYVLGTILVIAAVVAAIAWLR